MSYATPYHGLDSQGNPTTSHGISPDNPVKPGFARRSEDVQWRTSTRIQKYSVDQVAYAKALLGREPSGDELRVFCGEPEDGVHEDPTSNLLTTAGLNRITNLLIGGGAQALTNTSARLGVGNDTTAAAIGQTDLQAAAGSSNRQFKVMDATYPQQSNGVLTVKSTFGSSEANFAWQEWCIDIGAPTVADGTTVNALMLNRKVASLGTKASGASWAFTATVTLS